MDRLSRLTPSPNLKDCIMGKGIRKVGKKCREGIKGRTTRRTTKERISIFQLRNCFVKGKANVNKLPANGDRENDSEKERGADTND